MSREVDIFVENTTCEDVITCLVKQRVAIRINDNRIAVAGFDYTVDSTASAGKTEEMTEYVLLENTTYMGESCYGTIRAAQFTVADVVAQHLALYLNRKVCVFDPQSGTRMVYIRTDHPIVHEVLDGARNGIPLECPNFLTVLEGKLR